MIFQLFLSLAINNLINENKTISIYALENQFDNLLINFAAFVNSLKVTMKEFIEDDYKGS